MRILVFAYPEKGHINPTLSLASKLRQRGHEVIYAVDSSLKSYIEEFGFTCVPGVGAILRHLDDPFDNPRAYFEEAIAVARTQLELHKPDGVLFDRLLVLLGLHALDLRIPALCVNTHMPDTRDIFTPTWGISDSKRGNVTLGNIFRNWLQWRAIGRVHRKQRRSTPLGKEYWYQMHKVMSSLGLSSKELDHHAICNLWVRVLDQIILCPRELDFPRLSYRNLYYCEPSILSESSKADLEKSSSHEFPISESATNERVFCSLGSMVERVPWAEDFFEAVCIAIVREPSLVGIVAAGKYASTLQEKFKNCERLQVVQWAQQFSILKNTDLMITHCGLASVKECIYHGVPMMCTPTGFDQASNACKVEYHQLGKYFWDSKINYGKLNMDEFTECVLNTINGLKNNVVYRMNVRRLQNIFRTAEQSPTAPLIIETMFSRKSSLKKSLT